MSYTVLAVKWRPKRFEELVGQSHVVQALVNSLAAERLHHAYLFSGTRGVGKTTVARILAKALNCAEGVVAEPCGQCGACIAIDEGRFVDLIEVDAASRTRVDDTRELLDNVQYAPTQGRYKVYLIDEVHMLSTHSFNALLKTLEEPPPHVKFLLATTDPQKLPITVLSRCLQFNLKKLSSTLITDQLRKICDAESVKAEDEALRALARAADGSMRDALSLLDQSIAFGAGSIEPDQVRAMLGTIDRDHVVRLLTALAENDGAGLVAEVDRLDELAPDFGTALDELIGALQQIAVSQLVKGRAVDDEHAELAAFADRLSPEDVQLYYQIALLGRRDLPYSRDARMGFEMTLLRMLAFRPAEDAPQSGTKRSRGSASQSRPAANEGREGPAHGLPPAASSDAPAGSARTLDASQVAEAADPAADDASAPPDERTPVSVRSPGSSSIEDWGRLLADAGIRGPARQLGDNCAIRSASDKRIELVLAEGHDHLNTDQVRARLQTQLSEYMGSSVRISIDTGTPPEPTPAEKRAHSESARLRAARESIEQDSTVRAVQAAFGGVVEADTIQPIDD